MIQVSRRTFQQLAEEAWLAVPEELRSRVENLRIVIEDEPSAEDYRLNEVPDEEDLFGLFEGNALTESSMDGGGVLPNSIRIFQFPHEEVCEDMEQLRDEVTRTMHHELAHHFGLDDDYLEAIGAY